MAITVEVLKTNEKMKVISFVFGECRCLRIKLYFVLFPDFTHTHLSSLYSLKGELLPRFED